MPRPAGMEERPIQIVAPGAHHNRNPQIMSEIGSQKACLWHKIGVEQGEGPPGGDPARRQTRPPASLRCVCAGRCVADNAVYLVVCLAPGASAAVGANTSSAWPHCANPRQSRALEMARPPISGGYFSLKNPMCILCVREKDEQWQPNVRWSSAFSCPIAVTTQPWVHAASEAAVSAKSTWRSRPRNDLHRLPPGAGPTRGAPATAQSDNAADILIFSEATRWDDDRDSSDDAFADLSCDACCVTSTLQCVLRNHATRTKSMRLTP